MTRVYWLSNEAPDRLGRGGRRRHCSQVTALRALDPSQRADRLRDLPWARTIEPLIAWTQAVKISKDRA